MESLKKLRAIKGISQEQLGKEIGVSRITINLFESKDYDKISLKSAKKLADYYGISAIELFGIHNFKMIPKNDNDRLFLIKSIVNELDNEELKKNLMENL